MPTKTLTTILTSLNVTAETLSQHLRDLTAMITGAGTRAVGASTNGATTTTREASGWRRMNSAQRRTYLARKKAARATASTATPTKLKIVRKRAA